MNRRGRGTFRKAQPGPKFTGGSWGKIDSPEGVSRRVWVTNYPSSTTMEDLRKFFGHDSIEGISMNLRGFAYVQFKRPRDYSKALDKNRSDFNRRCISIEPYKEKPKQVSKPAAEEPDRIDNWQIIRARSRSKSPESSSSSSPRRGESRDSSDDDPSEGRMKPHQDSGIFNFNQYFNPNQVPPMASFVPSSSTGQTYIPYSQPILAQNQLIMANNGAYQHPTVCYGTLPGDIGLTLQLVLQQVIQDNEKRARGENLMTSGLNVNLANSGTSLTSQHVFPQRQSSEITVHQRDRDEVINPRSNSPNSDELHQVEDDSADDESREGSEISDAKRHEEAIAALQRALTK